MVCGSLSNLLSVKFVVENTVKFVVEIIKKNTPHFVKTIGKEIRLFVQWAKNSASRAANMLTGIFQTRISSPVSSKSLTAGAKTAQKVYPSLSKIGVKAKIKNWVKKHPVITSLIGTGATILINGAVDVVMYESIKSDLAKHIFFNFQGNNFYLLCLIFLF